MKNTVIGLILLAVLVIGGFYFLSGSSQEKDDTSITPEEDVTAPTEEVGGVAEAPLPNNSLAGTWQSIDDSKFLRTIYENGGYTDTYVGDSDASENGPWVTFTKATAPSDIPYPLEDNVTYLQLSGSVTLYFKILELSENRLTLVYLNRGNILQFVRVP